MSEHRTRSTASARRSATAEVRGRNPFTGREIGSKAMLLFFALLIGLPCLVVAFSTLKNQGDIISNPIKPPFPSRSFEAPATCAAAEALGSEPGSECMATPNLQGYRDAAAEKIGRSFRNSLTVVSVSVFVTLLFASMAAFAVTRVGGWISTALFVFFTIGMAIPAQVNGVAQYAMFSRLNLTNRLEGLMLVNVAATLPVSVFILTGFMRTLPKELFEAAVVDGAGNWKLFRKVVVPLSVPSLAAVGIFLLVMHWNDLWYPYLFITDPAKYTLPRTLAEFKGEFSTNYPALFAGVLIASAPLVTAYVFLQRWFIAGLTSGAVKG